MHFYKVKMNFILLYHVVFLYALIVNAEQVVRQLGEPMDEESKLIDTKNSSVWGPGLRPHIIVLPARYFFVKLVPFGKINMTMTENIREALKVRIDCSGDRNIWTQLLDRKDGSFIVRYKMYQSCLKGFRIIITFHKLHVGKSPYNINVPIHPDHCNCPRYSLPIWLKKAKCPNENAQIESDLSPFQDVDFNNVLKTAVEKFYNLKAHSFCHYVVKENLIYRKCYGEHVGFHMFSDSILLSLTRKLHLPDFEFIMNLGDWPLVDRARIKPPIPIFSWCKSNVTLDIILPTYELTEASLEAMGRVSLDMMSVQSNSEKQWEDKIPKLFWKGRDSRKERLDLISIGRKHPNLINASLTNFFFFRDQEKIYGPKEPHVSFFRFFDYKYQLNIDGTVSAYRFPFLLAGDSVVLKTDSPYIEHFYNDLKPWTHYIPVQADLKDLVKKIKWATGKDDEVRKIGKAGSEYARENLMPLNIFCYHGLLFEHWSKRLKNPVEVKDGMEQVVEKESPNKGHCHCSPKKRNYESDDGTDDKDEL
ncbi:protein O-glucosyltransferase 2 [Folsomia candida]|uniref:protein O-glucosyltransferase 2 n=1 Tax=Folsomia candida TaxID=158441 RepID=UPI000B8F1834|nr:protein O-glucosyltransferase 2 [Folsomia candida]